MSDLKEISEQVPDSSDHGSFSEQDTVGKGEKYLFYFSMWL